MTHSPDPAAPTSWWLDDVLLETALVPGDDGERTETRRAAVLIESGAIARVVPARPGVQELDGLPVHDGRGLLMIPTLHDAHLHLDKTFYGGPWQAPVPGRSWLAEEERLLPGMSRDIPRRSNAICDLIVAHGTTRVTAHCNVDHVVGTRSAERLLEVLAGRDDLDAEVVAYPQHGMRGGEMLPLLAAALRAGADVVGGLDPGSRERDIEGTLDALFDLALEHDAGLDFHIHDGGTLGLYEIEKITDRTLESGRQGRVMLSNASALGGVDPGAARACADRLAAARIGVVATVGVGGLPIPVPMLDAAGVRVRLGSDSITDILTPFGQGDILEQVWMLAQHLGWSDERRLAAALVFGAGEAGRWTSQGTRAWPSPGAQASFQLVDAQCTAQAVARRARRELVVHRGRITHDRREKDRA
ncbi:amidohydrolase family protein [Brachybacterium hainanense]|uniref:Amidohydrolase family protein n=1 Tax=Brachybacterium hainanense TaxID=1541174 RepID=A0ABV6R9V7_9MICO